MLKLIAIIAMLIDHTGFVLLPDTTFLYWVFRAIGRLAMPIFCYKLALGFIHTRSLPKYSGRLLLMTLAAQIPFAWMGIGLPSSTLWLSNWNVGLTFLCAIALLWCYEQLQLRSTHATFYLFLMIPILMLSTLGDYNLYGVTLVILFYFHVKKEFAFTYTAVLLGGFTILFYGFLGGDWSICLLQLICLTSLLCLRYIKDSKVPYLPKYFFYVFYPLHMLLLALIRDIFMA